MSSQSIFAGRLACSLAGGSRLFCGEESRTARWLRCVTVLLAVMAVATALIAPTIDIPDTVLPGHCASVHSSVAPASGAAAFALVAGVLHASFGRSAQAASDTRGTLQHGAAGVLSTVLRC